MRGRHFQTASPFKHLIMPLQCLRELQCSRGRCFPPFCPSRAQYSCCSARVSCDARTGAVIHFRALSTSNDGGTGCSCGLFLIPCRTSNFYKVATSAPTCAGAVPPCSPLPAPNKTATAPPQTSQLARTPLYNAAPAACLLQHLARPLRRRTSVHGWARAYPHFPALFLTFQPFRHRRRPIARFNTATPMPARTVKLMQE